jgi:hypothetical protein
VSISGALEKSTPAVVSTLLRPRTGALRQDCRRDQSGFSNRLYENKLAMADLSMKRIT